MIAAATGKTKMLIHDTREIAFDAGALVSVLSQSPQLARSLRIPAIPPEQASFNPDTCNVRLDYGPHGQPVMVGHREMAALLIAYCLRARIRIPRNYKREVRIEATRAVLVFSDRVTPSPRILPEREAPPPHSVSWLDRPARRVEKRDPGGVSAPGSLVRA